MSTSRLGPVVEGIEKTARRMVRVGSLVITLFVREDVARAGPAGTIHYPDLQMLPPTDIGIEYNAVMGQKLLRFTTTIANVGEGPLELVPTNNAATGRTDAYQRLYLHDESGHWSVASTDYVGTFIFHPQHDHWHFEDFARYELHEVAADGSPGSTVLVSSDKVSFCAMDSELFDSHLEHAGEARYITCNATEPQGISVGWADVYVWDLYGQTLDISGLTDGDYWLVSTADPDNLLNEGGGAAKPNNISAIKIRLGSDLAWVNDGVPGGAITNALNDSWTWVNSDPTPYSGAWAHQSAIQAGLHQHSFYAATETLAVCTGNVLFAYVYLDPANPPSEVMLEWAECFSCQHRAYWGADLIDYGKDGTASRRFMGPLPSAGQWVRLEVPASLVELEGVVLEGMSFTLFDGRATWDYAGVHVAPSATADTTPPIVVLSAPSDQANVAGLVRLSAEASDEIGVAGVQFKVDGGNWGSELIAPPFRADWNSFLATNGPHTLTATARDAAGNQATAGPVTVLVSNSVSGSMVWVEGQTSATNELTIRVFAAPGGRYVVQASADLLNWEAVATNSISGSGYFEISESPLGNPRHRFYRASSAGGPSLPAPRSREGLAPIQLRRLSADEWF